MKRNNLRLVRRYFWLRGMLMGVMLLGLALVSGTSNREATVLASTAHQDPTPITNNAPVDLCAILAQAAPVQEDRLDPGIGAFSRGWSCTYRPGPPNKDKPSERPFDSLQLSMHTSAEIARAQVSSLGSLGWVTTDLGDSGYGYEQVAGVNDAAIIFVRNCFHVSGRAGYDGSESGRRDIGALREYATALDKVLQNTPCSSEVDLKVDHIEVVQVVQDPKNTIPLVAGKKTVVRVFAHASGPAGSGPLSIGASLFVWPEGKSEVEVQPNNKVAFVTPNSAPDRDAIDSSVNFVIPDNLTAPGVFTLRAVVNPTHSIEEADFDNNDAREPFEFVPRNGLRVGFVRIGYRPEGQTEWAWPSDDITKYDGMMKKLFPAADNGVQYYEMPFRVRTTRLISSDEDGENLNWDLREYYDRIEGDKPDIMIGWLPNEYRKTFTFGGLAETVLSGQAAHVALAVDYHNKYSSDHVLPHEVGHNLGLDHTGTTGDSTTDCRVSKNDGPSYWPQEYGDSASIREAGFDTEAMKVIPSTSYDLMAYCSEAKTWLSPFHYKKLYDNNLRPQGAFVTDRPHKAWVRGWASFKGYTAQMDLVRPPDPASGGSASPPAHSMGSHMPNFTASLLLPMAAGGRQKANVAIQREGEGDHCLRFMDAGDAVLYERCFDLTFQSEESHEPLERSGFVLGVPDPGSATRVVLVLNENGQEQELTSLVASTHAPTLTITSPKSGDNWEGEHTIAWSADDADSDAGTLRYDILYSPDGKKSWLPLQVGSHETEYTFSTDEILPSDQTYVRILASDGFNTAHADVGPLVIPAQPNSPSLPPALPSQGARSTQGSGSLGSGLPPWAPIAAVGGILMAGVLVVGLGFAIVRSSRRRAHAYPAGAVTVPSARSASAATTQSLPATTTTTTQPYYPLAASSSPPPPPPYSPNPNNLNQFQRVQMEYARLRGELAAGRMTLQQYEAAVNAMRVQDQHGRYWMMGTVDGLWYVYDGRSWWRADPP